MYTFIQALAPQQSSRIGAKEEGTEGTMSKQVSNRSEKKGRDKESESDQDKTFLPQMYLLLKLWKKLFSNTFTLGFYE